jgi:adenylate cyclase
MTAFRVMARSRLIKSSFFGLLIGILGAIAGLTPASAYLEESWGLGLQFTLRGVRIPPPDVVIVSIDKASSEQLQVSDEPADWPRHLHAALIQALHRLGAALTVFDVVFDRERSDQEIMAQAMAETGNVVLADYLKQRSINATVNPFVVVSPSPTLLETALASSDFPLPKHSDTVRQFWTFNDYTGGRATLPVTVFYLYALHHAYDDLVQLLATHDPVLADSLAALERNFRRPNGVHEIIGRLTEAFKAQPKLVERLSASLRKENFPPRESAILAALLGLYEFDNSVYLNHYGPAQTIPTISYYEIIRSEGSGDRALADRIRGKVVFVGCSEDLQPEKTEGLFYSVFSQVSAVELAATAFANLLENGTLRFVRPVNQFLGLFAWGCLAGFVCYQWSARKSTAIIILACSAYLIAGTFLFASENLCLPLIIPLGVQAPLALGYAFMKPYLPRRSRLINGIILATDVKGYTTLAEGMRPEELGRLRESYFMAVARPIRKHKGEIANKIGDALFAYWDAGTKGDAGAKACRAALEIVDAVKRFNETAKTRLKLRMGLHGGEFQLKNVGTPDHPYFELVGDVCNAASRIEGLNKSLHTEILLSAEAVPSSSAFNVRKLGRFILRGMKSPLAIYQLLPEDGELATGELISRSESALTLLNAGNRQAAVSAFSRLVIDFPDDGPSRFYLDACINLPEEYLVDTDARGHDLPFTLTLPFTEAKLVLDKVYGVESDANSPLPIMKAIERSGG